MKHLAVVSLVLLGASCSTSPPAVPAAQPAPSPTLAGVTYAVPDGYVASGETEHIAVFQSTRYPGDGLFLTAIASDASREARIEEIQQRIAATVASGQNQTFEWRPNEAPTGNEKASAYEVYNERRHGFNGQSRIVVQYRQIAHNGRNLLTGYFYVSSSSAAEAAQEFRRGTMGDAASLGGAWASLVGSIVGEQPRDLSQPPPAAH